jgi:hypothetical protein
MPSSRKKIRRDDGVSSRLRRGGGVGEGEVRVVGELAE